MNKYLYTAGILVLSGLGLMGCGADSKPGHTYMPDMYYSQAYETYASTAQLKDSGVYYNRMPVAGTVARDEDLAYYFDLKHDSLGYAQSASLKNPLDSIATTIDMKEAERLYLVNCGICHGAGLDGNGPLFKGGDGPFTAAPKNFMADDMKAMAPGTMFYSVTYGKGQMGSYASQLSPKQRWEVIMYIKQKQGGSSGSGVNTDSTAAKPASDSASSK